MPFKKIILILSALCSILFTASSYSQQVNNQTSWHDWVAQRHSDLDCPWQISANNKKVCSWPGEFVGEISDDGMSFEMSVAIFSKEEFIQLPGSKQNWPTEVSVNYQGVAVLDRNGTPQVHLKKGNNIIRGKFLWQEIPTRLAISASLGAVKIFKEGRLLSTTINNNQLILSLGNKALKSNDKDSLKLQVFRSIEDGVPIRSTSIIKLFVSGKSREVTVGKVALAHTKAMNLQSSLPARLEENGMLRVQVKPGIYQVVLTSHFTDNISVISTDKISPQWPLEEYFSFIANPRLREVKISGVNSIDTSLFEIPRQWLSYPTYRLKGGEQLKLTTTVRGDIASHQNSINVKREIWLSFDGNDAISKDNISGVMQQGWRLNAAQDVNIGQAKVNAMPVLITQFEGHQGVEIRSPQINLQTVSTLNSVKNINAIGWQTDAQNLNAKIHLPPGWRALYASGVDGIHGTWIQKWNLWDIFWLMILIAAANKLLGFRAAILMTLTLAFTFHEQLAPNFLWAVLLAMIAIIRLPIGKYQVLLSRLSLLPAALLIITFIAITISSLRLAVYPTLEKQGINNSYQRESALYQPQAIPEKALMRNEMEILTDIRKTKSNLSSVSQQYQKQDLYQVGENDRVQTGPGIPTWSWNYITLQSAGMVTPEQQISLWLSSPLITAIWRILNVILIALMGVVMLRALTRVGKFIGPSSEQSSTSAISLSTIIVAALVPLFSLCLSIAPNQAHAETGFPDKSVYPPEYLLSEYESRLLKSPQCLPSCVSLDNGFLSIIDKQLNLRFVAYADADIAIALPSAGSAWVPETILTNNNPATLTRIGKQLMIYLPKGKHLINMRGQVNNAQLAINLPVNIHNFKVDAPLWAVDGVRDGVVSNNNIDLTSKKVVSQQETNTLTPLPINAYAIVHRTINLGKQWRVHTRVEKLAPFAENGSFTIKLLHGEQILSAYPTNDNGSVNIQIPKNQRAISWQSSLPITPDVELKADTNPSYSETWKVIPSSIWNVKFAGIKALKTTRTSGSLQPLWQPWPGETLDIQVERPEGVSGEIFTTEMAKLIQQTGENVQKSSLTLQVTASQGTSYKVALAKDAKITSVLHDGNKMSINSANQQIIQLHPGEQSINLEFEQRSPLTWRNSSAEIRLPGKAVNINIEYRLLNDRWLLYLNGPSLGASMLYWGVLLVILFGAFVLPVIARKLNLDVPVNTIAWVLIGIGFSTVNSYGVLVVALFFFAMAVRKQYISPSDSVRWKFNLLQLVLLFLTFICVASILIAIPVGLLSNPEMKVVGNGSYGHLFRYFQDKINNESFPIVTVYSLPIWSYRVVMLAWSLWLATKIISWGKWWFVCYSSQGSWIAKPANKEKDAGVNIDKENDKK